MNYREKTKLVDGLCGAFLMALLVELTYIIADNAYTVFHFNKSSVTNAVFVFAGIALAIAISVLIAAYRKENSTMAVYGLEVLVLAITSAILPGTYISLPAPFNKFNLIFPMVFGVYFIAKVIMLLNKNNKSNVALLAVFESIFIVMMVYKLYAIVKPLFFIGSGITLALFAASMAKKSKKFLVHGFECMLISFSMLTNMSEKFLIFICVMVGIYYLGKAGYRFLNPEKVVKKAKRRK